MRFEFKPSFERSLKALPPPEKEDVKDAALKLIDVLSKDRQIYQGLGLKRLRADFWELRKGIKARILFRWQGCLVEFVLAALALFIRIRLKASAALNFYRNFIGCLVRATTTM